MDLDLFKSDIQGVLADFMDSYRILNLSTVYQNATVSKPPNLLLFHPKSIDEYNIMKFNLIMSSPSHIKSEDDLASWLLDTQTINREVICKYLTNHSVIQITNDINIDSNKVLDLISQKICTFDVAEGFIEGLRIFLPMVGAIISVDISLANGISNSSFINNNKSLDILLKSFAKAHLLYCKKPLFQLTSALAQTKAYTLVSEICHSVIDLYKSLAMPDRPLSAINDDFINNIKEITKFVDPPLNQKSINEIFTNVTNGSSLLSLPLPEKIPTYLFTKIYKKGWIRLGISNDNEVLLTSFIHLTPIALYVFVDDSSVMLQGCIPLQYIKPHMTDNINTYSLIELLPVTDSVIPYIAMSSGPEIDRWPTPTDVTYHNKFILDILPNKQSNNDDSNNYIISNNIDTHFNGLSPIKIPSNLKESDNEMFQAHIEDIQQWLELIESFSWTSRNVDENDN